MLGNKKGGLRKYYCDNLVIGLFLKISVCEVFVLSFQCEQISEELHSSVNRTSNSNLRKILRFCWQLFVSRYIPYAPPTPAPSLPRRLFLIGALKRDAPSEHTPLWIMPHILSGDTLCFITTLA